MKVEMMDIIDVNICRQFPDKIFVFGDNLVGRGKGGQAVIRDEINSFGVPTKRLPSMNEGSFFSDRQDEGESLLYSLRSLYKMGRTHVIVFPEAGLGTGRALMKAKSPILWNEMCSILREHFGYGNGGVK